MGFPEFRDSLNTEMANLQDKESIPESSGTEASSRLSSSSAWWSTVARKNVCFLFYRWALFVLIPILVIST